MLDEDEENEILYTERIRYLENMFYRAINQRYRCISVENKGLQDSEVKYLTFHCVGTDEVMIKKNLGDLWELKCRANLISQIPAFLLWSRIERLDLSFNQIEMIPCEIGRVYTLKHVKLSNNKIKDVPVELFLLPNLLSLNLSKNEITKLYSPNREHHTQLFEHSKLRSLDLSENKLTYISEIFIKLPSLTDLRLNDNQLADISHHIEKINIKTFSNNPFSMEATATPLNFVGKLDVSEKYHNLIDISRTGQSVFSMQELCARKCWEMLQKGELEKQMIPFNLFDKIFSQYQICRCKKAYFTQFYGQKKRVYMKDNTEGETELVIVYQVCSKNCIF